MGPCLTFHLAGGGGGMAHMLDHFGAALLEPWTRLAAPPLTPQLRERMIGGCLREAGGRSVAELERHRDEFLAELLGLPARTVRGRRPGEPRAGYRAAQAPAASRESTAISEPGAGRREPPPASREPDPGHREPQPARREPDAVY